MTTEEAILFTIIISLLAISIALFSLFLSWMVDRVRFFLNHPIIVPHFRLLTERRRIPSPDIEGQFVFIDGEQKNFIGLSNDGEMDAKKVWFNLKFYGYDRINKKRIIYEAEKRRIYSPTAQYRILARKNYPGWAFSEYFDNEIYEFRTHCIWKIEALGMDDKMYCSCWDFKYHENPRCGWSHWLPNSPDPEFSPTIPFINEFYKFKPHGCEPCKYETFGKECGTPIKIKDDCEYGKTPRN